MAINNALTKGKQTQSLTFSDFMTKKDVIDKIKGMIKGREGERFITSIISAVSHNPELQKCKNATILSSALQGEALKLSPSQQLGQYYIVPFKDNKNERVVATFQIGYKGYLQLAIRSGQYRNINVVAIKKGELISYDPLTEELKTQFIDDDEIRENTETIGYYAMFETINGFFKSMYWSKKKMEAHAQKYSQSYKKDLRDKTKYTFWSKDFDGMAYKTMLRQLISKWGIMSIDLQNAIEKDMTITTDDGNTKYFDNDNSIEVEIKGGAVNSDENIEKEARSLNDNDDNDIENNDKEENVVENFFE
ncbi:MAG: recombinase RecT [Elusimicrobiota bacterium]|jgi:recombination protein RecT|nr:recombinase RecT [Elusimicrobiota bacterium]